MEFKGTKGKWWVTFEGSSSIHIRGEVSDIVTVRNIDNNIGKANALLISKAPELLQMVSDLKDIITTHLPIQSDKKYMSELDKIHEAHQLIKQATEL